MNGNAGSDTFVVRSFVAVILPDGNLTDSGIEKATIKGGEDDDIMQIGDSAEQVEEMTEDEKDAFAYTVNALVDLDGGTGIDRALRHFR